MKLDAIINPFENGEKQNPDKIKQVSAEPNKKLEDLLAVFRTHVNSEKFNIHEFEKIYKLEVPELQPAEINQFVHMLKPKKSNAYGKGYFLTRLIQRSYKAGYVEFNLDFGEISVNSLGRKLHADKEPIILNINGDLCDACAVQSINCTYNVQGNGGENLGDLAENCCFNVSGDVGHECGDRSHSSRFFIQGDAGHRLGMKAVSGLFYVRGSAGAGIGENANSSSFYIDGDAQSIAHSAKYSSFFVKGKLERLNEDMVGCILHLGDVESDEGHFSMYKPGSAPCTIVLSNKKTYQRLLTKLAPYQDEFRIFFAEQKKHEVPDGP